MTLKSVSESTTLSILIILLLFASASRLSASGLHSASLYTSSHSAPQTPETAPEQPLPEPITDTHSSLSDSDSPQALSDTALINPRHLRNPNDWIERIRNRSFNIYDTTISYPKFAQFCVNTYIWADHTFNSYDNDFVLPTGKNWKLTLRNDNWNDSYSLRLGHHFPIAMVSDLYASMGVYISFMAVSLGYSLNLSRIFGKKPDGQKRFDFNFNTALFTIDAYYSSNKSGSIIRRFGDYHNGKIIHQRFPDLELESYGVDAYYFFNHKRYSQGAVYNFSKYQIKSQGSFILGASANHQTVKMDFSSLTAPMQELLPTADRRYDIIYNRFSILCGYGYNFVLGPKWTINVTLMPSLGINHTFEESYEGRHSRFSPGLRAKAASVYNLNRFFVGINAHMDGFWHITPNLYFFNAITTFGACAGIRF